MVSYLLIERMVLVARLACYLISKFLSIFINSFKADTFRLLCLKLLLDKHCCICLNKSVTPMRFYISLVSLCDFFHKVAFLLTTSTTTLNRVTTSGLGMDADPFAAKRQARCSSYHTFPLRTDRTIAAE